MDQRVIAAIRYISEHLDGELGLKQIAQAACVSPFHFHRLFKQETQLTIKRFIESLKMEKAFQGILQPERKIQDIALDLGYNDSETFSRAFKRIYKISPDDLKRIIQKAMEQLNVELTDQQCIVIAFREESPAQITQKIMKTIQAKQLDEQSVLETVKAFSVKPAESSDPSSVKNKFIVQEDPSASEQLKKSIYPDT